ASRQAVSVAKSRSGAFTCPRDASRERAWKPVKCDRPRVVCVADPPPLGTNTSSRLRHILGRFTIKERRPMATTHRNHLCFASAGSRIKEHRHKKRVCDDRTY